MFSADTIGSVVVVATAMPLSTAARADLSEMLGEGYAVVDIKQAPSTVNILLTPVVSAQLLGSLRALYPRARILFTELHDDGRRISFAGPLSRIAAQSPDGYFVAHALDALAPIVLSEAKLQLAGSTRRTPPRIAASSGSATVQHATDLPAASPPETVGGVVVWIDRESCPTIPPGRWLDLEPIDDLVERVLAVPEPRHDVLWPAVVAECAVRLATREHQNVLVDIAGLTPATLADLQIRVASELVAQLTWPTP